MLSAQNAGIPRSKKKMCHHENNLPHSEHEKVMEQWEREQIWGTLFSNYVHTALIGIYSDYWLYYTFGIVTRYVNKSTI